MTSDQRHSYRFPVLSERRDVSVVVGSLVAPAQLVDESAGGFSVLISQRLELAVGQTLVVEIDGARVEARIAHVARAGEGLRLGLKRLDDLVPGEAGLEPGGFLARFRFLRRLVRLGDGLFTLEIVLLTVVLLLAVVGAGLFWNRLKPLAVWMPRARQEVKPDAASEPSVSATLPPATSSAQPGSPVGSAAPTSRFNVPSLDARAELSRWIERMPGPEVLMLPEVVKVLKLTKEQERKIRKIADDTQAVLKSLPAESAGLSRKKRSQVVAQFLRDSRQSALSVLTDEQKARWKTLQKNVP
ncbi:MAG: hypothetical protein ACYC35_19040 [Pirellulales bacterium]